MPKNTVTDHKRYERHMDKVIQKILGWDGMHNFVSSPIWLNTLLTALPDEIMITRADNNWTATHGETSVTGWSLQVALGRLIYQIDKESE